MLTNYQDHYLFVKSSFTCANFQQLILLHKELYIIPTQRVILFQKSSKNYKLCQQNKFLILEIKHFNYNCQIKLYYKNNTH